MVRLFYIAGISSFLAGCGVFGLCVRQWHQADPQHEALLQAPSAVRMFMESAEDRDGDAVNQVSPLVAQAEILAAYLDPPKPPKEETPAAPVTQAKGAEAARVVRPTTASVTFKLHGTSYYPNQPGRSMALIAESGAAEGNERWVKEGSQVGHFVIHEIRHGAIVYRDGDNLREMALEPGTSMRTIVRDVRLGARQVSSNAQ